MDRRFDVLVIGGGVAGAAAAFAATSAGARCAVVRASPGATGVSAGAWQTAPPPALAERLVGAGLPLVPCATPLAHPVGDVRTFACAAASHVAAAPQARALVIGIAGLPGFRAGALARLWGDAVGADLQATTLALPDTPAAGWAPASLAAALERDAATLADEVAVAVRRAGAPLAIVPAVLGRSAWQPVHGVLERAAGVPVGEALGVPPSLPGLRLHDALERALEAAGVEILAGRVAASTAAGEVLEAVRLADRHGARLEAAAFVLATGRFVGGGIVADPEWREPALATPLSVKHLGVEFALMEPLALSSPDLAGAQPWLAAGVRIDAESRPVGANGEARYRNVHAAGTVIAGHAADLGEAARSGWHAGTLAAASAGAAAR